MRILVIGRDGQLGQSLREVAAALGVAGWAELSFIDRETIDLVSDQWGAPTSALELARGLMAICAAWRDEPAAGHEGTYHFAGSGETNWAGLARAVFEASAEAGRPVAEVVDIATADWPAKAKRPANSRLCSDLFATTFGYRAPDWRQSLSPITARIVKEDAF